jgi:hypothetical protein
MSLAFFAATYNNETFEVEELPIGTGPASYSTPAGLLLPDNEGVYRSLAAGAAPWHGARWVTNLYFHSEDFSNTEWKYNDGASYVGIAPVSGPSGETAYEISSSGLGNIRQNNKFGSIDAADVATITALVRAKSGTVTIDPFFGTIVADPVTVDENWTLISFTVNNSGGIDRLGINPDGDIYIVRMQAENVNGLTNQNPSEYIPTTTAAVTKLYANANGNTVTSNVVTEAAGALLSELRKVTNQLKTDNVLLWPLFSSGVRTGGVSDPFGGTDAYTYEATLGGTSNFLIARSDGNANSWDEPPVGTEIVVSVWIRRRTGTGIINFRDGVGTNNHDITSIVTSDWQRISLPLGTTTGALNDIGWVLDTAGDEIDIYGHQIEFVNGQTNQNPAELVITSGSVASETFNTENGNTVTNNVVTEATGDPLPLALPSLYAAPALTNDCLLSNDLRASASWTGSTGLTTSFDQVGITGEPNTATRLEDTDASTRSANQTGLPVAADTTASTARLVVEKTVGAEWVGLEIRPSGGAVVRVKYALNTITGYAWAQVVGGSAGAHDFDVVDAGGWWHLYVQLDNDGGATTQLRVVPATADADDAADTPSATGACVVGNVDFFANKTIAEVRGAAPIITAGTAASTVAVGTEWLFANWPADEPSILMYMDFNSPSGETYSSNGINTGNTAQFNLNDTPRATLFYNQPSDALASATFDPAALNPDTWYSVGGCGHGATNEAKVGVDGLYGITNTNYKDMRNGLSNMRLQANAAPGGTNVALFRNMRIYNDFADFAAAETLLDALMAGEDLGFPLPATGPAGARPDEKYSALGGPPSHIDDLEIAFLQANGATSDNVNTAWREYLTARGFTTGNYNTDMFAYLGSKGYTGALPDRLAQWWAAGAPV